eukprot:m.481431 g.481431  ORF g.481431 m.481431 type:complete len:84 (-) comp57012_c0_seq1:218-469(-)
MPLEVGTVVYYAAVMLAVASTKEFVRTCVVCGIVCPLLQRLLSLLTGCRVDWSQVPSHVACAFLTLLAHHSIPESGELCQLRT